MKRVFHLAVTATALLALVGCSGGSSADAEVRIVNSEFNPAEASIKVGGSATWTNDDAVAHTVTTTDFDSGAVYPQESYSRGFREAGTYDYYCRYHTAERGKLTVR